MTNHQTINAGTNVHKITDIVRFITRWLAILMSAFHVITAAIGSLPTMQQRATHLGFALMLVFLQSTLKKESSLIQYIINIILSLLVLLSTIYVHLNWFGMAFRVAAPRTMDLVVGVVMTSCVLWGTYKRLGWPMPTLAAIFIVYGLVGPYLPGSFSHRGYSFERITTQMIMSTEGIYGSVLGVSATYIFLFVLFGAILEYSGAAKFFIDLATGLFARTRGGSAKISTLASCLFGMVSGSSPANIMAIGPLTLPMMERVGYTPRFGGAILSVAGTGGQLMPPIMGAAAFIIAETLAVPYLTVALAAFIPGLLYYASLWFIIDIHTAKIGIPTLPPEEIPDWRKVLLNGFYLSIPFILLVFFLAVIRWSPIKAGFWSITAMIVSSWIKKATRMGLKEIFNSFEKGAYGSLEVATVTATAGVIVGMLSMTGLGLKFSSILLSLSGGNLVVLLILTSIAGIILGMGMTTTSVYIILSVLIAPALVKMGIEPLGAHLFVFYFGILSSITPPVAIASYAAASVAKTDPMSLGWEAARIGLAGYILPFMFLFNRELLFMGSAFSIIKVTITSFIGIYAMSCAIEGFCFKNINIVSRLILAVGAIFMIDSGFITDLIGLALLAVVMVPGYISKKGSNAAPVIETPRE